MFENVYFLYKVSKMKTLKIHYKKPFYTPLESPSKVVWKKYFNFFIKVFSVDLFLVWVDTG